MNVIHSIWKVTSTTLCYGYTEGQIQHSVLLSTNIRKLLWALGKHVFEPEPIHAASFSTLIANSWLPPSTTWVSMWLHNEADGSS